MNEETIAINSMLACPTGPLVVPPLDGAALVDLSLVLPTYNEGKNDLAGDVTAESMRVLEPQVRQTASDPHVEVIERDGPHAHAHLQRRP